MPSTSRPSARSRSSAEGKYRELLRVAFEEAEGELAAVGLRVELRRIDAAALAQVPQWEGRRVSWNWPEMMARWRRNHTNRFEVAVWQGDFLCGVALGRPSSTAAHASLHYIETNPDPANPLRRRMMIVVLAALRRYATVLGKTELRLVDPLPALVPFYCSPVLGFQLVTSGKETPYCSRSI
jgi:hypothetical protein